MLSPGQWRGWSRNTPGRSPFTAASHRGLVLPLISRPSGASPSISTASSDIILSSTFSDPEEKVQTVHETVNILLVDNEPGGLLALEAVLEPLGQKLITARSGQEALRQLLAHDFALILLDIRMPELDGFQTAALIRERERSRHTPIIFLTASYESDVQVSRGYAVGAVEYEYRHLGAESLRPKGVEDGINRAHGVAAGLLDIALVARGEKYDRGMPAALAFADQRRGLEPVQFRHSDVEQDESEIVREQLPQRFLARPRGDQLLSKRLEYRLQGEQAPGLVVYKEDVDRLMHRLDLFLQDR